MIECRDKRESRRQIRQRRWKLLICLLYCLAVALSMGTGCQPADAAGFASGELGTVKFIEWHKVESGSEEMLPTGEDAKQGGSTGYYMLLVWWDYYAKDYRVFWGADYHNSHSVPGLLYSQNEFLYRYFELDSTSFITSNAHGMPRIYYDGDDSGNPNYNGRGWHTYKIKLNEGNGDWVGGVNCTKYGDSMVFDQNQSWGFAVDGCGGNYTASAKKNGGSVCIYYNLSGHTDPGFRWNKNGNCYAEQDKDYDDHDGFSLWIGKEVEYSALDHDYTVTAGSVLNIDGYVIITDDVKLTIEPGAVCSIEGNVINNGEIVCNGTLIIQENACLCPFDAKGSLSGRINLYGDPYTCQCKNGKTVKCEGSLIVMNNGKLAVDTTKNGQFYAYGATIVNYGLISIPKSLTLTNTYVENRGSLLVGYQVNGLNALQGSKVSGKGVSMTLSGGASIWGKTACTLTIDSGTLIDNYGSIRTTANLKPNVTDCGGACGIEA